MTTSRREKMFCNPKMLINNNLTLSEFAGKLATIKDYRESHILVQKICCILKGDI